MLPKTNRLTKNTSISRVAEKGLRLSTPNLFVKYLILDNVNNAKNRLKLAISVGIKLSKKAVVRNQTRRRVAEAFREVLKGVELKTNVEILVIPKNTTETLKSAELSQEAKLIINKILKNG